MRADFVANASHELRTPLASIKGFVETLLGPAKDDEEARIEFLKIMLEQSDRMQQLIGDLLSLSKIEMNIHSVPTEREILVDTPPPRHAGKVRP
jgi:two-component system, OmpR family, phosphate regulon sensor histidine kinase PhoR